MSRDYIGLEPLFMSRHPHTGLSPHAASKDMQLVEEKGVMLGQGCPA